MVDVPSTMAEKVPLSEERERGRERSGPDHRNESGTSFVTANVPSF